MLISNIISNVFPPLVGGILKKLINAKQLLTFRSVLCALEYLYPTSSYISRMPSSFLVFSWEPEQCRSSVFVLATEPTPAMLSD